MSVVRRAALLMISLVFGSQLLAQFYTEDFGTSTNCLITSVQRADTATLQSGDNLLVNYINNNEWDTNTWFVSSRFSNSGIGGCGNGCLTGGGNNNTLHISTQSPNVDPFATYNPDSITDVTACTREINLTGITDVYFEFECLLSGEFPNDSAQVGYKIGNGAFIPIQTLPRTDTGTCGLQGEWVTYGVFLPSLVNNLPNARVGFRWYNDSNNIGTPVSFAVDNLALFQNPPIADFEISRDTICVGQSVDFTDLSQGNVTAWSWDFGPNANPGTSTAQNPTNISFSTAGVQSIELTSTNSNGSDVITKSLVVINCSGPTPAFTTPDSTICQTQCIDFTDISSPGTFGKHEWIWQFQGVNPPNNISNVQNPQNICYTTSGTYNITLTVVDTISGLSTTDTFFNVITVDTCSPPTANFEADTTEICNNDTIQFTELTTGIPDSFIWIFQGGNPAIDSTPNPSVFYPNPGTWDVTLIVWNSIDTDTVVFKDYIRVNNCPQPRPRFTVNERRICPGTAVVFEDLSNFATSWDWEFPGGIPAQSNAQNPTNIQYNVPGRYPVILTVSNVNGDSTLIREEYIIVDSCLPPDARFELERDSICRGSCVQFFNTSLRADSIFWVFNKVYPDSVLDSILLTDFGIDTNNVDTTIIDRDSLIAEADSIVGLITYFTDTIFMLDDPILCFDDSLVLGLRLFTFNQYDVDVANFIDFPVLNVGGEYPKVNAGPDKVVRIDNIDSRFFLDDTVRLEPEGTGNRFLWFPEEGLSCYECKNPVIYPTETRKYYLTNVDEYGCEVYDSLTVFVEEAYFAGIPNIFSPNGDDNNDILWVRGNGISSEGFVLRIYDRYGKLIFESFSQNDGWDGTFGGSPAPQGVYMYEARFQMMNGQVEQLTGNVTLVRY